MKCIIQQIIYIYCYINLSYLSSHHVFFAMISKSWNQFNITDGDIDRCGILDTLAISHCIGFFVQSIKSIFEKLVPKDSFCLIQYSQVVVPYNFTPPSVRHWANSSRLVYLDVDQHPANKTIDPNSIGSNRIFFMAEHII